MVKSDSEACEDSRVSPWMVERIGECRDCRRTADRVPAGGRSRECSMRSHDRVVERLTLLDFLAPLHLW